MIEGPPTIDRYLLEQIPMQQRQFSNGDGFRLAMNKLEELEEVEDQRLKTILSQMGNLQTNMLTGAPDILNRMVAYCTELRREHDLLISQDRAFVNQNA